MDHYESPRNHGLVDDDNYKSVNMDSETCIDNIDIQAPTVDLIGLKGKFSSKSNFE